MRLGPRHQDVLGVLGRHASSRVEQILQDVAAVRPCSKTAAEVYAVLDQLQTVGLVTTSRTPTADGDSWALTPRGRTRRMELT